MALKLPPTRTSSSSSEEFTHACATKKSNFWVRMASFWELSWGCSSALNTVAPMIRYSTTRKKIADTVFHLMTVVRVSHSSSGVVSTTGLVENDRRGLELWAAAFGSRRSGAATARTQTIYVDQCLYMFPHLSHHSPFLWLDLVASRFINQWISHCTCAIFSTDINRKQYAPYEIYII